ncbi:FecR domain-containing protein [Sphingomonas sp. 2R-10]|uniref:FecR family protein n=1 Tax=Sphingomonas sp. 2R-10 TaxID=3045148 RepID=UPI0013DDA617|nr:FecR domain-containing protein [Sphingomonas sp. 2R-10]MDJ0276211.1 FecR domain-containing protein [Sphingomonas sp. 2R-10]
MHPIDDEILDTAADWFVKTSSAEFEDWDRFAAWIAQDERHREAYAAVGEATRLATVGMATAPSPQASMRNRAVTNRRVRPFRFTQGLRPVRMVAGGAALAATVAGIAWISSMRGMSEIDARTAPDPIVIASAPGERREIRLSDGSSITLAGASRVRLETPRSAVVESGRAVFSIVHDAPHPFSVRANGHRLVDAGTRFEVALQGDRVQVSVAEGVVLVNPAQGGPRLLPGNKVEMVGTLVSPVTPTPAAQIGNWALASIDYRAAPLGRVASDLSIALGVDYRVEQPLASARFTGVIAPASLRGRPQDVAALLRVRVVRSGDHWQMVRR